ncbi:MAG: GntR family transcriptional regulator [Betaproteobacteria bacterium]|nr:GntR family transcriptional regulator [Betaproteobacteria bacterium]
MSAPDSSPAFKPLYQQIKILITQSLISGEWRPGEAIPSEIELANRYNVSQGTVRKAINELADENLLIRHQGKGTFVASHTEERRKFHFMRIAPDQGRQVYPDGELLACRRGKADSVMARLLEINTGATLVVVTRVMKVEGRPLAWEEVRLPAALFKGLNASRINEFSCRLYSMFESAYGVRILQVAEQIKAVPAPAEAAQVLGVPEHSPLLNIDRLAYTFGDKPVEWRRTLCDTREFHYMNKIV